MCPVSKLSVVIDSSPLTMVKLEFPFPGSYLSRGDIFILSFLQVMPVIFFLLWSGFTGAGVLYIQDKKVK